MQQCPLFHRWNNVWFFTTKNECLCLQCSWTKLYLFCNKMRHNFVITSFRMWFCRAISSGQSLDRLGCRRTRKTIQQKTHELNVLAWIYACKCEHLGCIPKPWGHVDKVRTCTTLHLRNTDSDSSTCRTQCGQHYLISSVRYQKELSEVFQAFLARITKSQAKTWHTVLDKLRSKTNTWKRDCAVEQGI